MAPKALAYNRQLVQALRAKQFAAQANNSLGWHAWQKAADAVEAVRKHITIDNKDSVKNLPKEGHNFGKTAREYCERLMRGAEPFPSSDELARVTSAATSAAAEGFEHPYLRTMQHRGGGYAILMAFRDAERSPTYPGFLTIKEIQSRAQPYCSIPMKGDHFAGRDHNYGWESNKSLLSHNLIERDKHGRGPATGFRGPVDHIRLTSEGRAFIPKMLDKFGGEAASTGSNFAGGSFLDGVHASDRQIPRGLGSFAGRAPSRLSQQDAEELQNWARTASTGDEKEFHVGKDRRKHLHQVLAGLPYLQAQSIGDGRCRKLIVRKVAGVSSHDSSSGTRPSIRAATLHSSIDGASDGDFLNSGKFASIGAFDDSSDFASTVRGKSLAHPHVWSGKGQRLGGQTSPGNGPREAALAAAERRASSGSGGLLRRGGHRGRMGVSDEASSAKRPRTEHGELPNQSPALCVEEEGSESSSSSSDSDAVDTGGARHMGRESDDEDLQQAIKESLACQASHRDSASNTSTNQTSPHHDDEALQQAIKLSLAGHSSTVSSSAHSSVNGTRRVETKFRCSLTDAAPMDLDSDAEADRAVEPSKTTTEGTLSLLVDLRERGTDRAPRDIYETTQRRLAGIAPVGFEALRIGDYLWLHSGVLQENEMAAVVCIERKTIRDLIGRSAKGDHIRQLRRLGAVELPWTGLLVEGSEEIADKGAVAYGATPLAHGTARDTAIRSPVDVLRFIAEVVLFSNHIVLLADTTQETIAHLVAWTSILMLPDCLRKQGGSGKLPSTSSLPRRVAASDERHATLAEAIRATTGLFGNHLDVVCNRFISCEEISAQYKACKGDGQRQAMLVPILSATDEDSAQNRKSIEEVSVAISQVFANGMDSMVASGVKPPMLKWPLVLCVEATAGILQEIRKDVEAGVAVSDLPYLAKGAERVRFQLQLGLGNANGEQNEMLRSPLFIVAILKGEELLSGLQKAFGNYSSGCSQKAVAEVAAVAARQLLGAGDRRETGCQSSSMTRERRKILIFEAVDLAATRVCKSGSSHPLWGVASRVSDLVPALIAALAVRHGVVALPRKSREKTLQLVRVLGQIVRERALLTA